MTTRKKVRKSTSVSKRKIQPKKKAQLAVVPLPPTPEKFHGLESYMKQYDQEERKKVIKLALVAAVASLAFVAAFVWAVNGLNNLNAVLFEALTK